MMWIGLLVTLLGFALSVVSLGVASGVNGRLVLVLIGISLSLAGIIGILNPVFVRKAIWKK